MDSKDTDIIPRDIYADVLALLEEYARMDYRQHGGYINPHNISLLVEFINCKDLETSIELDKWLSNIWGW